jgi:hypothetical protein
MHGKQVSDNLLRDGAPTQPMTFSQFKPQDKLKKATKEKKGEMCGMLLRNLIQKDRYKNGVQNSTQNKALLHPIRRAFKTRDRSTQASERGRAAGERQSTKAVTDKTSIELATCAQEEALT